MRVLGAILAGGQARRFGSDKATALLDGMTLIDRVARALTAQVESTIVCGREPGLADRPAGIGPLGGIAAALHFGLDSGFDAVLTAPCDTPCLPATLRSALERRRSAYLIDAPVIGLWRCDLAEILDRYLSNRGSRSVRAWASHIGATPIEIGDPIPNINTPDDLDALSGR